jgi:hypothetical protein
MVPVPRPTVTRRCLCAGLSLVLLAAGGLSAGLSPAARAAPAVPAAGGELDGGFGGYGEGGRLLTQVLGTQAFREAVQLPDGAVIAVGTTGADFLIARYAPDGSLDPDFGSLSGWQIVNLSAGAAAANAVALAADGKLVVAGVAAGATGAGVGSLSGYLTRDFAVAMNLSGRVDVFLQVVSR